MKKTICIFMCLVMALSICSCSKSGTVVALEVGGVYDADDGGNHASDYDVWYSEDRLSFEDLTSASTYTIEIDGTEYSGEYSYSGVGVYNNYQSDYYTIVSDICSGQFAIKHKTNEIVEFTCLSKEDDSTSSSISIDVNHEKADEYVSQLISLDDYDIDISEREYTHGFTYTKKVGEISTWDYIKVVVSPKTGKIISIYVRALGSVQMNNAEKSVSAFTSESAEETLKEKIYAIYPGCDSYEIKNELLVTLDSGEYGIVYRINALYGDNDEANAYTTNILVCYSSSVTE